ncbi:xanthine dehydrogenase family protein molybdopterin-binding subunit, partial [Candidatus Bipolaricaulota bacterium]|nr:xanthine dehydrogenase family protein molybdopterin-binding subunit [Candidatus Bipolaricaulota bacterium]
MTRELSYVGKPIARADAVDKVTGAAQYTHDLCLPGMLHTALILSPHASARIVSINTEKAKQLPGVRAVLTGKGLCYQLGLYMQDKCILARDVVRYQGEAVVAIAADTFDIAKAACNLVDVEYDTLPSVLDPRDAMEESAHLVHPDLHTYEHMEGVFFPKAHSNIAHHQKIRKGAFDQAFEKADIQLTASFYNPP